MAADLGGTNLRMAAIDYSGSILHRVKRSTPHSDDAASIVDAIVESATECLESAGGDASGHAIGLAVPATIKAAEGVIVSAPNLPSLNGLNLSDAVCKRLGLAVVLENDGTSAAIGEHWLGASKDVNNSIFITLGTGVGGGIIINGIPLRGIDGTAGEVGHICVEPMGAPCGCGSCGCVEQYASATAIVRMTREMLALYPNSIINGAEPLASLAVYEAGVSGDELAIEVYRKMGYYLGIAVAGLINILNPEMIVFGGGMSAAWDLFFESARDQIRKRAFRQPCERAKLVRAKLGDDAGMLGVARLAFLAKG